MKDVIDLLLQKQATLKADCEAEKALACEKIDAEYSERSEKIVALLDMAGYVPTVAVDEPVAEEAAINEETEAADAEIPVAESKQIVY